MPRVSQASAHASAMKSQSTSEGLSFDSNCKHNRAVLSSIHHYIS